MSPPLPTLGVIRGCPANSSGSAPKVSGAPGIKSSSHLAGVMALMLVGGTLITRGTVLAVDEVACAERPFRSLEVDFGNYGNRFRISSRRLFRTGSIMKILKGAGTVRRPKSSHH